MGASGGPYQAGAAATVTTIGGIVGGIIANKQRKKANATLMQLLSEDPTRPVNKYPGMQLGWANNAINAKVPGLDQYQRQLDSTYGSQISNINRNATDASQALALGAAAGGQRDFSSTDTLNQTLDWKKYGLANLNAAYAGMTQEQQAQLEDQIRRFGDKAQILGVIQANKMASATAGSDATIAGAQVFGGAGGYSNIGQGGGGWGGSTTGSGGATSGTGNAGNAPPSQGYQNPYANTGGGYTYPSDIRLKENYFVVDESPSGINIWEFSYKNNPKRYRGVMAHENLSATIDVDGYLWVDYSKLDVEFTEI